MTVAIAVRGRSNGRGEGFRVISGLKDEDHARAFVSAAKLDHQAFRTRDSNYRSGDLLVFEESKAADEMKALGIAEDVKAAVERRVADRAESERRQAAERAERARREAEEKRQREIAKRVEQKRSEALVAEIKRFEEQAATEVDAELAKAGA